MAALPARADCVVLLHGLARSPTSLLGMETVLTAKGFRVVNVDSVSYTHLTLPTIYSV